MRCLGSILPLPFHFIFGMKSVLYTKFILIPNLPVNGSFDLSLSFDKVFSDPHLIVDTSNFSNSAK